MRPLIDWHRWGLPVGWLSKQTSQLGAAPSKTNYRARPRRQSPAIRAVLRRKAPQRRGRGQAGPLGFATRREECL